MKERKEIYKIMEEKIGDGVRRYRNLWETVSKHKVVLPYPLHLNLELTGGCNLQCEFCVHGSSLSGYKYSPKSIIEYSDYCKIIDDGMTKGLCSIELNGINEPLFKKDIHKYISYAKKSGILEISLHTNALLLDEEFCYSLIESGLTLIMFSVDAISSDIYSVIRSGPGSDYLKMRKNILLFLDIKKKMGEQFPFTRVSFVDTKINNHEKESFINYWRDKVDLVSISSFINPFIITDKGEEIEKKYRVPVISNRICSDPYQRLLVRNNGDICPCCSFFSSEMPFGNIKQDSIEDVWMGEDMMQLRHELNSSLEKRNSSCKKCYNACSQ
jgi:radical SAM protein with 4Fe4S-binding SPASM domain